MESKHDKWLRLSKKRSDKIDEQLRLITNLRNKSNYEYTEQEVEDLFDDIMNSVIEARRVYMSGKKFTFK